MNKLIFKSLVQAEGILFGHNHQLPERQNREDNIEEHREEQT